MAKLVNLIYNTNNGPIGPSGGTPLQGVAGVAAVSIYAIAQPPTQQSPNPKSITASAVIQSNGELIGNAQLPSNPLPPGLTS
jgi:hypothetical protein